MQWWARRPSTVSGVARCVGFVRRAQRCYDGFAGPRRTTAQTFLTVHPTRKVKERGFESICIVGLQTRSENGRSSNVESMGEGTDPPKRTGTRCTRLGITAARGGSGVKKVGRTSVDRGKRDRASARGAAWLLRGVGTIARRAWNVGAVNSGGGGRYGMAESRSRTLFFFVLLVTRAINRSEIPECGVQFAQVCKSAASSSSRSDDVGGAQASSFVWEGEVQMREAVGRVRVWSGDGTCMCFLGGACKRGS